MRKSLKGLKSLIKTMLFLAIIALILYFLNPPMEVYCKHVQNNIADKVVDLAGDSANVLGNLADLSKEAIRDGVKALITTDFIEENTTADDKVLFTYYRTEIPNFNQVPVLSGLNMSSIGVCGFFMPIDKDLWESINSKAEKIKNAADSLH